MNTLIEVLIVIFVSLITWITLGLIFIRQKWKEKRKIWLNYENEYGDVC